MLQLAPPDVPKTDMCWENEIFYLPSNVHPEGILSY